MQAESMLSRTLFVVAVSLASTATSAADFYLDEFTVTRGGATVFQDTFSDGVAPPNAPDFSFGVPGAYAVFGSFAPGSEAGGKLRLDTLAGSPSCNAPCEPDLFLRARLLTNADPGNLAVGLKSGFTFTASALYDFSATPGPMFTYGMRFDDQGLSNGNDVVELRVRSLDGQTKVLFTRQDFSANTFTILQSILLPGSGFDQLGLTLSHVGLGEVKASFELYDDGVSVSGPNYFGVTTDIFHGENWTRASFFATQPIPEPSTYAMLLAGLGMLGFAARRRRQCGTA
jgi:hypothetical protein